MGEREKTALDSHNGVDWDLELFLIAPEACLSWWGRRRTKQITVFLIWVEFGSRSYYTIMASIQIPTDIARHYTLYVRITCPWRLTQVLIQFIHCKSLIPTINAKDLEVLRLTALYTAKNGEVFKRTLAHKENNNFQFDFLCPTHNYYLFQLFPLRAGCKGFDVRHYNLYLDA